MSEKNKKKFVDRLQFLGVIGPFVVLLTLFAILLRGSTKGWYLFFATLMGLPLSWKWRLKGFLITLASLTILYGSMFSFFSFPEKLWQMGASISLALGLFTTYLGFEEIKMMMQDLQIESQSRLDNLIELDDKFNRSKKDWDLSEEEYQVQTQDKDRMIERLSEEADALEKTVSIIESNLTELQNTNARYIEDLEQKETEKSKLEIHSLKLTEKMSEVEKQLAQSLSERETELMSQNESLTHKVADLENKLFEVEEKLLQQEEFETNYNQETSAHELNAKKMEESLREKMSEIYGLKDQIAVRENNVEQQKEEIQSIRQALVDKEHEIVNFKTQINERDRKINEVSQRNRDLDQDLLLSQASLEEQKEKHKLLEKKLAVQEGLLEKTVLEKDQKIGSKDKELENLYQDLEEKGEQLNLMVQRTKEAGTALKNYEEEKLEREESFEESKKQQLQELAKLNEARFALFQANLDKERLRKEFIEKEARAPTPKEASQKPKHWLLQVEALLKQDKLKKIDLERLPKEFSNEVVTLNQAKAMYKQLRMQFEDKNKILDEVREKLFKTETKLEKLTRIHEEEITQESKIENELEKSLFVKEEEVGIAAEEISGLNTIIQDLLKELQQAKG